MPRSTAPSRADTRPLTHDPETPDSAALDSDTPGSVVVVGGGLAGCAAAVVLAEHGKRVTVLEREAHLGGRVGGWETTLATGEMVTMERGFHAFFRHYYNLSDLLRRVDPQGDRLNPLTDYPLLGPSGQSESFSDLPVRAPFNFIALVRRSKNLRWFDLPRINVRAALEMLRYERKRTYQMFDSETAEKYLDSLNFPPRARTMLFEVFSHSFFNPEAEMSAAELLMMFHFYFLGNPEGLIFDVLNRPFSAAIWQPMATYLRSLGVEVRLNRSVTSLSRNQEGFVADLGCDESVKAESAVLAVAVPALKKLVIGSQLGTQPWRDQIGTLNVTSPFVVWRLWLDRPSLPGRAPFAGTAGFRLIDNISLYHLIQDESQQWAERHNGSVVELHSYAIPKTADEAEVRRYLWQALIGLYPEYDGARVLDERFLWRQDCPSFAPCSDRSRPLVDTPWRGLKLAGDFVKLEHPTALMERAVVTGYTAANQLLSGRSDRPQVINTIPHTGLLAGRSRQRSKPMW